MKTQDQTKDIKGSYVTPDGKAQIDFGITYRNGYPEFTAEGFYDGSSGQCIDSIAENYPVPEGCPDHPNLMVHRIHEVWKACHLQQVNSTVVEKVERWALRYPFRSFYDQQAETFLARNGLKFRATLSNTKVAPCGVNETVRYGGENAHYRVTISRNGVTTKRNQSRMRLVFDFFQSYQATAKGEHPSAYDVLACISSDAYCPDTFEGFCDEYGYERDSIRALQTFKRADRFAKRLRAFFTEEEINQLSEIR